MAENESNPRRKQYEYIDEFILAKCGAIGDRYTHADVEAWAEEEEFDIDVSACLTAHRESPKKRTFTSERHRMGPHSYYELVERPKSVSSAAVLRMHQQQGTEMVKRWINEYRFRMEPVAARSKKAQAALQQAEAEIKLVASAMSARLAFNEQDEDEDEQ